MKLKTSIKIKINGEQVERFFNLCSHHSIKLYNIYKLENNYYVLHKKNVDIVSMIEFTVGCVDKYAKQKNIQLIFDTNEDECIMAVDPEAIDRIIMNLLSNAIKFSHSNTNIYIDIFVLNLHILHFLFA